MNGSFLLLSAAVALGSDVFPPLVGSGCSGCSSPVVAWAAPVSTCAPCAPRVGILDRLRAKLTARPRLFANTACAPACAPAPVATCAPVTCAPAPVSCGQPVFTGFTTSCSDPCERVGLLARLRAKFAGGRSCDASAAPLASASWSSSVATMPVAGCTTSFGTVLTPPQVTGAPVAGAPVITGPTTSPPAPMPAPMPTTDPKKDDPKKDEPKKDLSIQVPPLSIPSVDLPRVPPVSIPSVDLPRVPSLGGTTGKY